MKIADLHADIGYDCMQKKKQGFSHNVLSQYHVENWKSSNIQLVCMVSYFEGYESWKDMQEMIVNLRNQIMMCKDVDLVLTKQDLLKSTDHIKAIMSVEGMCGVKENVTSCVEWMYKQGIRVASLCWNDENALATGVRGNEKRGLQEKGYEVIETMKRLGMIVDVSHANDQTFWDIMQINDIHVMASHSNVRKLCNHKRNLTIQQIQEIRNRQGIIGLNAAPYFIHTQREYQDIKYFVKHLTYLKQRFGDIQGIACGFDFMDYFENETQFTKNLQCAKDAKNLIRVLQEEGFNKSEIQSFLYDHVFDFFSKVLC